MFLSLHSETKKRFGMTVIWTLGLEHGKSINEIWRSNQLSHHGSVVVTIFINLQLQIWMGIQTFKLDCWRTLYLWQSFKKKLALISAISICSEIYVLKLNYLWCWLTISFNIEVNILCISTSESLLLQAFARLKYHGTLFFLFFPVFQQKHANWE